MDDKKLHSNVEGMSSLVKDSRTHPLEVSAESKHELKMNKDKYSEQTILSRLTL